MEKTTYKKGEHTVTVASCRKVVNNVVKNFHILGTGKYYIQRNAAIKEAKVMLLKMTLTEADFKKRKAHETRVKNAHRVNHVCNFVQETEIYLKKWDGVLYMETKKRLCEESKQQLAEICKKLKFKNAHAAIGLLAREIIIKNKKNGSRT